MEACSMLGDDMDLGKEEGGQGAPAPGVKISNSFGLLESAMAADEGGHSVELRPRERINK